MSALYTSAPLPLSIHTRSSPHGQLSPQLKRKASLSDDATTRSLSVASLTGKQLCTIETLARRMKPTEPVANATSTTCVLVVNSFLASMVPPPAPPVTPFDPASAVTMPASNALKAFTMAAPSVARHYTSRITDPRPKLRQRSPPCPDPLSPFEGVPLLRDADDLPPPAIAATNAADPDDALALQVELLNIDNLFLSPPPPAAEDDVPPTVPCTPEPNAIASPHPQSPLAAFASFLDESQPPATSLPRTGFFNEDELSPLGVDLAADPPERVESSCSEASMGTVVEDQGHVPSVTITPTSISGSPVYSGNASTSHLETTAQRAASGRWFMTVPQSPLLTTEDIALARPVSTPSIPDLSILLHAYAQKNPPSDVVTIAAASPHLDVQRQANEIALRKMRAEIEFSVRVVTVLAL